MKKLISLSLTLLCLVIATTSFVQGGCKLCEDWKGVYQGPVADGGDHPIYGNIKYQIRIKRYGEDIQVREKTIFPDGHSFYEDNNSIIYYSEEQLSIKWSRLLSSDRDPGEINGIKYEWENYYIIHEAVINGNMMTLYEWTHRDFIRNNSILYFQMILAQKNTPFTETMMIGEKLH